MMVVIGPAGQLLPAAGEDARSLTQFSDGSQEELLYFPSEGGTAGASITLPRNAHVTSAAAWVRALPGQDGAYPSGPWFSLAENLAEPLWRFGELQAAAGEMGRQRVFNDGLSTVDVRFPAGGGSTALPELLLPGDAAIRTATMRLAGAEGPHGAPWFLGSSPDALFPAWNARSGNPVVACVANASVMFSELDPYSGAELRHKGLAFPPEEFTHVSDVQYRPEDDSAAVLVPGSGIFIVNLSSGDVQRQFAGPENSSLVAMRYGGGWLAAVGIDWAAVRRLPAGDTTSFNASSFPAAFAPDPAVVDYDPAGRRLFVGGTDGQGTVRLCAFRIDDREAAVFSRSDLPASILAMRYDAGRDQLVFGLGPDRYGRRPEDPVRLLSLANGTFSAVQAFAGAAGVANLRLDGEVASALTSGPGAPTEVVRVDLGDGTYEAFVVQLPTQALSGAMAFDPVSGRLLAGNAAGGLWLLDLNNGHAWPLAIPGTVPAGVNVARTMGSSIVLGTTAGVLSVGTAGMVQWRVDCGAVSALAVDGTSRRLAAAASVDWTFDTAADHWRYSRTNVTILDPSTSPPSARSWQVPFSPTFAGAHLTALVFDPRGDRLFLGGTGYDKGGGLFALNLSTGGVQNLSSEGYLISSLALSPDGSKLFAGTTDSGILIIDLINGTRRAITPLNGSAMPGPHVSSLLVDEFGRLLAGQGRSGAYPGGLTIFSPDLSTSRSYAADAGTFPQAYDVLSLARDPATGRVFLGLGNDDGLAVVDENANTEFYVPGIFSGPAGGKMSVDSLCWSTADRTLLGVGGNRGFTIQWAGEHPRDVRLDVGDDGTVDWSSQGRLDQADILDLSAALQGALAGAGGDPAMQRIRLRLTSSSAGLLSLRSLVVTYDLSKRIDLLGAIRSTLASRPAAGNGTVAFLIGASGGGLSLFNLSVTYLVNLPPVARAIPELSIDAASRAPTTVDLGRYFSDDHTPGVNLTYAVRPFKAPPGVAASLLFSRYLLIDARESGFRGQLDIAVTASDSDGLSTAKEVHVNILRSNEYVPPPPAYNIFLWASAAVLISVGAWIIVLYIRVHRRKDG